MVLFYYSKYVHLNNGQVLVVIEHPRSSPYGGKVAGPVFKEIVSRTFLHNDIRPEMYQEVAEILDNPEQG